MDWDTIGIFLGVALGILGGLQIGIAIGRDAAIKALTTPTPHIIPIDPAP